MKRRLLLASALAAALSVAPALADDTLTGTLVSVDGEERSFTIQTSEGKHHTFLAPVTIDVEALPSGSDLRVTAQAITDVGRDERRQATAVAVLEPDPDREEGGQEQGAVPRDPASGAPGGGPPSGGIPGGGVPSGGAPGGGGIGGGAP
jgi:hypothetical protein